MGILDALNPYRWLLWVGLAGALGIGYVSWAHHQQGIGEARATARYNIEIDKQKAQAIILLDAEKAKVTAVESSMRKMHFEQEIKDVKNQKTVTALNRRLRDLAPDGMFRDPHAQGRRPSGGDTQAGNPASTGDSAGDGAEAGGLLSKDLSRLLSEQAQIADDINIAYIACRTDSIQLREALRLALPK